MTSDRADSRRRAAAGTSRSGSHRGGSGGGRLVRRPGRRASWAVLAAGVLLLAGPAPSLAHQPSPESPQNSPEPSLAAASLQNLSQPTLHHNLSQSEPPDYVCQPVGPCQPCPFDQLTNPVCQIYQNRRLVDCIYLGSSSPALIASILRDPSTYATGLMKHRTWVGALSETDSSWPPSTATPPPTSTTTSTSTRPSTSNDGEAARDSAQDRLAARASAPAPSSHQDHLGAGQAGAEFQSWEACERVVLKEQQDFYEFALSNLAIAALSLLVYAFRTKQLVVMQYGKLAARIGILPS